VELPERGGAAPTQAALARALSSVADVRLTPWVVRAVADTLLDREPAPGAISRTVTREDLGLTEWTLSNGARVVLLPTTFSEDQIVFSAIGSGGLSLAADADLVPAQTAVQVVAAMGFGRFSSGDLRRWMTGRSVSVQPTIGPFEQGLSGGSSRQDLETLFQLIYLAVTAPRRDPVIFDAVRSQLRDALANQAASPDYAFAQAMADTLTQGHPRARPVTAADLAKMDMDRSLAFYKERFGDAAGLTFVFAGSFDLDGMRPLVKRYVASLPSSHRGDRWQDAGVRPPRGVVTRLVPGGLEPKSRTVMIFTGPMDPARERAVGLTALADVLQMRLADALREELGGTYTVNVGGTLARVPIGQATVSIDFTSDPARADALADRVLAEIARLQQAGPTARQVDDARAALLRNFETSSRQNAFLVAQLAERYQTGEPPETLWQLPAVYAALTPAAIRDLARTCLDERNYVRIVQQPGR
jgi:zinc protease